MILRTGKTPRGVDRRSGAFTLIELVLVMGMLLTVLALAAPSLSNFFRGRNLDSEARRLLALSRHGQSRAVSEGVPMVLWLDAEQGRYGLRSAPGYDAVDLRAVEHDLARSVTLEVPQESVASLLGRAPEVAGLVQPGTLPMIRFEPGGVVGDGSPLQVALREGERGEVWLVQNENRTRYDIQSHPSTFAVAR